jgi:hypothetical protein
VTHFIPYKFNPIAYKQHVMKSTSDTVKTIDDLNPFLITSDRRVVSSKVRGLVIVPGGGGKTTIIKDLQETIIACSDIDDYWEQQLEKDKVQQLTSDWNEACTKNDLLRRRQIEDEYVLLKAKLSKTKWLTEQTFDLLFIQTYEQASILMDDDNCIAINLLPTAGLHHENLYKRAIDQHPPKDFDVCQRQWQENYKRYPHILYNDFNEFHRLVFLFHQFILAKRMASKRNV